MAINFPDAPSVNDTFTVGDRNWLWNGASWEALSSDTRTVASLTDTVISTPTQRQVLEYNGTNWANTGALQLDSLEVIGNLTVGGTTTTVNANDLVVSDPMIYIGEGNTSDVLDLGFVASHTNGTYAHTGLVRDATDDKWKLFDGVTDEPTTTVNFAQATNAALVVGDLDADSILLPSGDLQTTLNGKVGYAQPPEFKTTSFTLDVSHNALMIPCSNTITVTVPQNVFVPGSRVDFINYGTGIITFTGTGLVASGNYKRLVSQYTACTIYFISDTVSILVGRAE